MNLNIPTINDLPIQRNFNSGEKIIIERNNQGAFLLDFDNIYIQTKQINFRQSILDDFNQVRSINALAAGKYNELRVKLFTPARNNYTVDLNKYTSLVSLQNKEYITTNATTPSPFSKTNNVVNFNNVSVNNTDLNNKLTQKKTELRNYINEFNNQKSLGFSGTGMITIEGEKVNSNSYLKSPIVLLHFLYYYCV